MATDYTNSERLLNKSFSLDTYMTIDGQPTGVLISSLPGRLHEYYLSNNSASIRYVKLYDKATAPSESDTPLRVYAIPAYSAANVVISYGILFRNGIGIRVTTGVAHADTGAPTANDVVVNIGYNNN